MQSNHLERGNRKIEILYLEAKLQLKSATVRAWYRMEWKMEWNGTEISVWNMEDARMEWNGRFQEWNGRQSSILPCQISLMALTKNVYG